MPQNMASSVLNNDPTRRYFINKLYQPMSGQQEDPQPVEPDDEYSLYQELRFLEATAQELTDERQRVQLTKILEDDEGDDDYLDGVGDERDDPLDLLQLTTIIEGFESFPSSPCLYGDEGEDESEKAVSTNSPTSSTCNVTNSAIQSNNNQDLSSTSEKDNSIYKTNQYQSEHITMAQTKEQDSLEDADISMDDEASSNGGRRNPLMSKYRRRTANARERIRMREINQAFEKLKKVVPIELIQQSASGDESDQTSASSRRGGGKSSSPSVGNQDGQQSDSQSVKLTKITTLRLAVSYIAKLSEVLEQHPEGGQRSLEDTNNGSALSDGLNQRGAKASNSGVLSAGVRGKSNKNVGKKRRGRTTANRQSTDKRATLSSKERELARVRTEQATIGQQDEPQQNKDSPMDRRVEPQQTIVLNQEGSGHPFIITNNLLQGSFQQQQPQQQANNFVQFSQRPKQQFATYAQCGQQQFQAISPATNNGQDRTFMTPVAVAILGIPTTGNNQISTEPQALQLLGIQSAQQLPPHQQHQQQQHQQQQRPQQIQMSAPYNIISHQPQQVTLTLDDVNGLSLLRLANPNSGINRAQQATFQLQPSSQRSFQPQILATTTTTAGYTNYTTSYQPIQLAQMQQSGNITTATVRQQQQQPNTTTVQFSTAGQLQQQHQNSPDQANNMLSMDSNNSRLITTTTAAANSGTQQGNSVSGSNNDHAIKTTTGNNSDYKNIGISPKTIAQHLSQNSNVVVQAQQQQQQQQLHHHQPLQQAFKIQQSNCQGQILTNNLMAIPQSNTQLFKSQSAYYGAHNGISGQANVIYINPPTNISTNNGEPVAHTMTFQQQQQPLEQQQQIIGSVVTSTDKGNGGCNSGSNHSSSLQNVYESSTVSQSGGVGGSGGGVQVVAPQFEQMKFVTQFSSQTGLSQSNGLRTSEANIRQLVASITTSIRPNGDSGPGSDNTQANEQSRQQQPPKRTYRFHNYDGNMITNHLYNNNNSHDKQIQQHTSKRPPSQQLQTLPEQAVVGSQRSRQNSLSSTCSTISSSSSSHNSISSVGQSAPLVARMIKSPPEAGGAIDGPAQALMNEAEHLAAGSS